MSILEFMEMSVAGSLFSCLLAVFICLSFAGIGEFFLKGRHGIVLHSVVGMAFVGAIVTFFAGCCAALCKYIIYISIFFGAFLTLKNIFQKKRTISDFYALVPFFILLTIFLYKLFAFITPHDNPIPFMDHLSYFASVSIEIFKADYFSRLRMIDVYPYEWSKYHFFTGSMISIPLLAFAQKNYVSFVIAKTIANCFVGGAIFDMLREKYDLKKSAIYFSLGLGLFFMCLRGRMCWGIVSNDFFSIAFLVMTWIFFMHEENAGGAIII